MNYRKAIKRAAIIVPVLIVLWCWSFPLWVLRYELTLEVETPEGLKTGASVIAVKITDMPPLKFLQLAPSVKTKGQAVFVDLGERGLLFGLMRSPNNSGYSSLIAFDIFQKRPTNKSREQVFDYLSTLRAKADLPKMKLPMLVRFRDVSDPTSVEEVNPDDLAKSFGSGVSLRRATIKMIPAGSWPFNAYDIGGSDSLTGIQVTTGIETKLVWLLDPAVMQNPGWSHLPQKASETIIGLRAGN